MSHRNDNGSYELVISHILIALVYLGSIFVQEKNAHCITIIKITSWNVNSYEIMFFMFRNESNERSKEFRWIMEATREKNSHTPGRT